jgi:hypothetical protein
MDNEIEVVGGLSPSDRLINNPLHSLREGDSVRIVRPRPGYDIAASKDSPAQSRSLQE